VVDYLGLADGLNQVLAVSPKRSALPEPYMSTTFSAVTDGATVPTYCESRLAKLEFSESERPKIDAQFEEAGGKVEHKEKLKTK
jgi:hypothetical protein